MADNTISEPIQKCVAILKGAKADTEKFAGLFMVTKLVKGADCNSAAKKALFDAIGFPFLNKLLKGETLKGDDCPPIIYKSVALSVLVCFCGEEELATSKEMLANIGTFFGIIEAADDMDDDSELIVVTESYKCLMAIASYAAGQKALLDFKAIARLTEIYSNKSFQTDEALHIICAIANKFGREAWAEDPTLFNSLMQRIGLDFETDHSERKFELCTIIASLLFNCRQEVVKKSAATEIWPESLFKGLNDTLKSKIGKAQRDPALILSAAALELLGVDWALTDAENPKTFFLLLLQLAAIEVRMHMDNKSFSQAIAQGELLTACFIIMEVCINYMTTDQLDLEAKEKQSVYTALKGAFNGVLTVLTKLSKTEQRHNLQGKEKAFAYAIVRVMSSWLSHETTAMRPGIYQVLPYMFELANSSFKESRQFRLDNKENASASDGPADILRVFLPALCHLTVEEKARDIILKSKQDETLYEALVFHFSIVNWKPPPIPRAERLARMNDPKPEPTPREQEHMEDSRGAVVSICNIFMNLTVLEAKVAEESANFRQVSKFIFENHPELKESHDNLVVQGNMTVLGLLMLKQQAKQVKKNDFTICRFVQVTIRWLWDAYTIDESSKPDELSVSIAYKERWGELSELWFLGMQTMAGLIPLFPMIAEFAMESGWAEGIIKALKQVKAGKLQANVKSAYEDVLGNLVDANKEVVVPKLKKADALKVCRTHKMMELGKRMFGDD